MIGGEFLPHPVDQDDHLSFMNPVIMVDGFRHQPSPLSNANTRTAPANMVSAIAGSEAPIMEAEKFTM